MVQGTRQVAPWTCDTIIADWEQNAEQHGKWNLTLLRRLKRENDWVVDWKAHRLHEEAFSLIDCTQCANCRKTIHPLEDTYAQLAQVKYTVRTKNDFFVSADASPASSNWLA